MDIYLCILQKLEQTVSSNALLEQELLVLRQKLQASRDSKNNQTGLGPENGSGATAMLESGIGFFNGEFWFKIIIDNILLRTSSSKITSW